MSKGSQKDTREYVTKGVPAVGSLVVLRAKDERISAIIKLTALESYNALGWPVWSFGLVYGSVDIYKFTIPLDSKVELCLALIDGETDTQPRPLNVAREVFRPFHVYVEDRLGGNTYQVYKFLRKGMARKVLECANRFGLVSFMIVESATPEIGVI